MELSMMTLVQDKRTDMTLGKISGTLGGTQFLEPFVKLSQM